MDALVDINVWFAILLESHEHHSLAYKWWDQRNEGEATWCRITQHGVLRLLTNRTVMGQQTLKPEEAWNLWEIFSLDERMAWMPAEPDGIDVLWKRNITGQAITPKLWTDAWLAALAEASGLEVVTFDRGFKKFEIPHLRIL